MPSTKVICLMNGTILTEQGDLPYGSVLVEEGRMTQVGPVSKVIPPPGAELIDAEGLFVAPGFLDMHIHGSAGHDFMQASMPEVFQTLRWLSSRGVTSCLPSIMAASPETLLERVSFFSGLRGQRHPGAQMLGLHLEGPFLNPLRPGAQPVQGIRPIDVSEMDRLLAASAGAIRLVTLAPELPGAVDLVRRLTEQGVHTSVGHSDATYAEVARAVEAGLDHVTHCYNAMREFHHREPGVVGAALALPGVAVELILDGVHVAPAAASILLRCKGLDRVILVSDAVAPSGCAPGRYHTLDGRDLVSDGRSVRLPSGQLAGSVLSLDQAVHNACNLLGLSVGEAVQLASLNPARALGVAATKGSLAPGKDADLVLLDRSLEVQLTMVQGEVVFTKSQGSDPA